MMKSDNDYDLVSNTDLDLLLVDMPLDLIKETIRDQINDPIESNVNYIESVLDKYKELVLAYGENQDTLVSIRAIIIDFFSFIIDRLSIRFDMSIQVDYNDVNETIRIGSALYNFLILSYKKNISKYITKFINKNKKSLVDQFEGNVKRKDVTSIAVRKKTKNKDDVAILSNLPNIIKYIMNLDIEPVDFLKYVSNDENYEANIIKNQIVLGNITGNFAASYIAIINNEYDYILDEVQTDVRTKMSRK